MLNGIILDFVNAAVSGFLEETELSAFKFKLLDNSLFLSELKMYKYALLQFDIPLIVHSSSVKDIKIRIPWNNFNNESVVVTIGDVFLDAEVLSSDPSELFTEEEIN